MGTELPARYLKGMIMGFFDNFFGTKKTKTEQIQEDRDKIKNTLDANLKKIGFTALEIKEVLDIVTITEANIQILKDSLIGTNINTENPLPIMEKVTLEIRQLQQEMAVGIKKKVQEIQKRKADFKKEL